MRFPRCVVLYLCACAVLACSDPADLAMQDGVENSTPPGTNPPPPVNVPGTNSPPFQPPQPRTHGYTIHLAGRSGDDLGALARGHGAHWSPDGTRIAYESGSAHRDSAGIYILDVGAATPRRIRGGDGFVPRWSPDGNRIGFLACIPNDANGPFPMCDATFTVINADGSGEVRLARTGFLGTIPPVEWSPDGRMIAYLGGEGSTGDLYVISAAGGEPVRVTSLGTVSGAAWSPDGRTIAVIAGGSVYTVGPDGSNLTRRALAPVPLVARHVAWSPAGDRIAFSAGPNPVVRETRDKATAMLYVIDADGSNRIRLASDAWEPRWLPDGRTISFSRWSADEVWTVPAAGGAPTRLLEGFNAQWSPDGSRLVVLR